MTDDTIQFTANGGQALEVAVREALAAEGRPPSKSRVRTWIRAGDVVVEGRAVTDPGWAPEAGDRVVVAVAVAVVTSREPGAGAGCAASIRHLDRHLIVAEWDTPSIVGSDAAVLGAWLRAGLEESGVKGLCPRPIPDPVVRVSGLVAAALSPASEARLFAALGEGRIGLELTVLAEVLAEADTSGLEIADAFPGVVRADALRGVVRVVRAGTEGAVEALADLRSRGLAPLAAPGPGPASRRPLLAHVTRLSLPHPTTGRDLTWSAPFRVEV